MTEYVPFFILRSHDIRAYQRAAYTHLQSIYFGGERVLKTLRNQKNAHAYADSYACRQKDCTIPPFDGRAAEGCYAINNTPVTHLPVNRKGIINNVIVFLRFLLPPSVSPLAFLVGFNFSQEKRYTPNQHAVPPQIHSSQT